MKWLTPIRGEIEGALGQHWGASTSQPNGRGGADGGTARWGGQRRGQTGDMYGGVVRWEEGPDDVTYLWYPIPSSGTPSQIGGTSLLMSH